MLKRTFLGLITLLLFLTSNASVSAQGEGTSGRAGMAVEEERMIAPDYIVPPNRGGMTPFSGQNHFYSLVFRGNGEAIVTLRVALTNTNETGNLSEVTLRVPEIADPQDLSAYQIIVDPPCVRYADRPLMPGTSYTPVCIEYGEPDYYYYYGGGKYQKAETDFSGDTLKVTLATPIEPNKTGSFFVYFRGFGLTDKNLFGAYNYEFESLKVEDQINELRVGISTDSDQFLKSAEGEVGYLQEASVALKAMPTVDAGATANPTFDRFISQIGYGQITKTASNLASLESYKVEGMYADSRAKLYGREIVVTLLTFLVLGLVAVFVIRRFIRKASNNSDKKSKMLVGDSGANLGLTVGVGLASALVVAGYTLVFYAISNLINDIVDYQYHAIVAILLVVVSFAIYILILVGPAVFVGLKRGIGWGIATFVSAVVWLVVVSLIAVLVLFIFRNEPGYPRPMPFMGASERSLPAVDLGE